MALQTLAGGDTVSGTACMVPLLLHAPAGVGVGVGGKAAGFDTAANILRDGVKWLYANRRYIWMADYSMYDLKTTARQLGDALQHVDGAIGEARSMGWLPFAPAGGWVRDGAELMRRAGQVVLRFNELAAPGPGHGFRWDPCSVVSRCVLNSEAVMWRKRMKRHVALGERKQYLSRRFEDVAIDPAKACCQGQVEQRHGPSGGDLPRTFFDEPSIKAIYLDDLCVETGSHPPRMPLPEDTSVLTRQQDLSGTFACHEKVQLSMVPEVRAVPVFESRQKFPVLVCVKAPVYYAQQARAPIDLVMVLDISAAMASGLHQLKKGAKFAIRNLRQEDRLSMVTLGPRQHELAKFRHMSDDDKRHAIEAVESLDTKWRVHISFGLKKAYEVLHKRSEKHRASGIILLSDGKDAQILKESHANIQPKSLEESDRDIIAQRRQFPTYTLGLGANHDPRTLYYLARQGHGTYSFVHESSTRNIEDAMALCIGGLTSIVAQDVEVAIEAAHPEVKISDIKRGLHEGVFSDNRGRIKINDLFGDEEKNFIVYVNIPEEEGHSGSMAPETCLLTAKAEYNNPLIMDNSSNTKKKVNSKEKISVDEAKVYVERPVMLSQDCHVSPGCSPEVETEIYRVHVLDRVLSIWNDDIAAASHHSPYTIEAGVKCWNIEDMNMDRVLNQLKELLADIDPTEKPSWDPDKAALRRKLYSDISKMIDGMAKDVVTGLPYMLSWLSSHGRQRAATRAVASDSSFLTVRMKNMLASVETAVANMAE